MNLWTIAPRPGSAVNFQSDQNSPTEQREPIQHLALHLNRPFGVATVAIGMAARRQPDRRRASVRSLSKEIYFCILQSCAGPLALMPRLPNELSQLLTHHNRTRSPGNRE